MTDEFERLVSGYLNGDLTPEETETLRKLLASDPAALTEFVRAIDLHAELRKVFHETKGNRQGLNEIRQEKRRRVRLLAGSIAAGLAIAAGVLFFSTVTTPVARLEKVVGQVRLVEGTDRAGVTEGQEIRSGQGLETLGEGRAVLRYPDGTALELGPRTLVREFAPGGENRVVLSRGTIAAEVVRQPADRPLVFATPHGEAKVLGTSLKLKVEAAATRLEVTKGVVRLTRGKIGDSADVAAGHFAAVSETKAPESKALLSERVRRMAPNSWLSLPDTQLRQVVPDPARFPKVRGIGNPKAIIDSWSGGALDTRRNRLLIWGGGHTNYRGNEVYAFDLESIAWERLTDPGLNPAAGRQVNDEGAPIARATYNGLAYIAHADRMFALGGDSADSAVTPDATWTFDLAANSWENRDPIGDRPPTWVGATSAYDPATRKVWWGEGRSPANAGLYSYDFDLNRWTRHTPDFFYYQTSAVDTRRGRLVSAGDGKVFAHDVRGGGTPTRQVWRTTGGDALLAKANPGFDYDSAADRLVGWGGGAVHVLHPGTKTWTSYDAPGAPPPTPNGIFGRWRYVPSLDVFVVVTGIDENVHLYKLPEGD